MTDDIGRIVSAYKLGELSLSETRRQLQMLAERPRTMPLSEGQLGLWLLHKMAPDIVAYNVPVCFRTKRLEIPLFKKACQFLTKQHPMLSATFKEENGLPYQVISAAQSPHFEFSSISSTFGEVDSQQMLTHLRQAAKRPFDLERGPLFRIHVFQNDGPHAQAQETIVLLNVHHIVFDGQSIGILLQSLLAAYAALTEGRELHLIPLPEYLEYITAEQELLAGDEGASRLSYWKGQLAAPLPRVDMTAYQKTSRGTEFPGHFRAGTVSSSFSVDLCDGIRKMSEGLKVYPSAILLGILQLVLKKYTGQSDLIVGMAVDGRAHAAGRRRLFDDVLGFFTNMVPVRSIFQGGESLRNYLFRVQKTVIDGVVHGYPFPSLVRQLNLARTDVAESGDGPPVFQIAFMYQNFLEGSNPLRTAKDDSDTPPIRFVDGVHQEGEYELVYEVLERKAKGRICGFDLNLKYDSELYDVATIERLAANYRNLIANITSQPMSWKGADVDSYSLLSENERTALRIHWNDTERAYPRTGRFDEMFELQASKTPHATAASYKGQSLTYQELEHRSRVFARHLRSQGLRSNVPVGIYAERSLDMLVGLLAILRAGGAYVPLDPGYPEDRLRFIISDSNARFIVTQTRFRDEIRALTQEGNHPESLHREAQVIFLDDPAIRDASIPEGLEEPGDTGSVERVSGEKVGGRYADLAYVIYTSGSTGNPKGVMITHSSLLNFLVSMAATPGMNQSDKILAITTYCFDIAGLELFLPLLVGAHCHICDSVTSKDPDALKELIARVRPSVMQATPSTWAMLFHAGWSNEERVRILCGGEALPEALKQHFVRTGSEAWNLYGPTETTIWSMIQKVEADCPTTIGRPIANTRIYILDSSRELVPMGVSGELCIAGDGVSAGYLNRPELTADRFIDNPFEPAGKLYRTGDLARWTPYGSVAFMGRIDFQVKIRGFRVELGEIENQLNSHPEVRESVVVVKADGATKQLIAYYVSRKPDRGAHEDRTSEKLARHLKGILPDYMVPSFFVALDKIPLTPNGKVDRKHLMNRRIVLATQPDEGPRQDRDAEPSIDHAVEAKLLAMWTDLLKVENLEPTDRFFEMGGNSLSAVILSEKIRGDYEVPFRAAMLFKYTSIRQIAAYIREQTRLTPITRIPGGGLTNGTAVVSTTPGGPCAEDGPRAASRPYPESYNSSLAIIGISCQFPGALNQHEFWNNLKTGKESARFLDEDELRRANVSDDKIGDPNFVPVELTIGEKDLFDPEFFNLSPKNSSFMDPQFRLLLLHSWKAIEDAGYVSKEIPETSVFMSVSNSYYQALLKNAGLVDESDEYVAWLLAQGGTVPTMISYELGFKGPSIFVHTNCSSSLVAVSLAYQNLHSRDSKYALVGASSIFSSSDIGYVHRPGLNFSSDGRCKAFDAAADGMVAGEGVGVVVLKRAQDAVEDGDHIYALLRSVAVNNDGSDKAGYYSPSVNGQADVIRKALDSAAIDPGSISYVEAHGTGTKLGDPIEVMGLAEAYRSYTSKTQFCGIGSIKPNVGHLDTAAGLAGLIKVALSLKHKQIPPSINFKQPNPDIDFSNSPFFVVDHLKAWTADDGPRRAALSSFGIGGTNAHAILEEHRAWHGTEWRREEEHADPRRKFLVPLSARNQQRLHEHVKQLLEFLSSAPPSEASGKASYLERVSYTLQTGREAMRCRAAFAASDVTELMEHLREFLKDRERGRVGESSTYWFGEAKKSGGDQSSSQKDEDRDRYIANWVSKGELQELAKFWTGGAIVDWRKLYEGREAGAAKPRRISLPTYPFAKERYWVPTGGKRQRVVAQEAQAPKRENTAMLHPLLHSNTSNLATQRFTSMFTGEEFFLRDHQIRGEKVFPGVAYVEMAYQAIKRAVKGFSTHKQRIQFRNVVWAKPITVGTDPREVHVELRAEDNGEIAFKILTENEQENGQPTVHGQGSARLLFPDVEAEGPKTVDVAHLKKSLTRSSRDAKECYETFRLMGFDYGPALQGIEAIYVGEGADGQTEVLAKLVLPSPVRDGKDQFALHPSLLDSALQASIGMVSPSDPHQTRLFLPFGLEGVEVLADCSASMWAWVRRVQPPLAQSKGGKTPSIQKLDIDLCDESGTVCVRLRGFSSRAIEGESLGGRLSGADSGIGLSLTKPVWVEKSAAEPSPERDRVLAGVIDHKVFLCGFPNIDPSALSLKLTHEGLRPSITSLVADDEGHVRQKANLGPALAQCFEVYALKLFEAVRRIFEGKPKGPVLLQVLVPAQGPRQVYSALAGLLRTARLENPKVVAQLISVENESSVEDVLAKIQENSRFPEDEHVRYERVQPAKQSDRPTEKRMVVSFKGEVHCQPEPHVPWKNGGVYLITGGVGGLGLIFAREAIDRISNVTLILAGRSAMNDDIEAVLTQLRTSAATVEYQSVDVSDEQSVEVLIDSILDRFGTLNGVLHGAGVIRDNFIWKKTAEEVEEVLKPKVRGVVNLDHAAQRAPDLDFFVLFSSGVAVMGNAGQADYAMANAFMDAFCHVRNALVASKERKGQTLSINWPLWADGGMSVNEQTQKMMEDRIGMVPMDLSSGISAFYHALGAGEAQVLVMFGSRQRIQETTSSKVEVPEKPVVSTPASTNRSVNQSGEVDAGRLLDKLQFTLMKMTADMLTLSMEDMDGGTRLSEYGFDSISLTNLSNQLNQEFRLRLSPTIFFEYPTIEELAGYLAEEHRSALADVLMPQNSPRDAEIDALAQ